MALDNDMFFWGDRGRNNLFLYGIRNLKDGRVNEFDDILGVCFLDSKGNEVCIEHEGTTDPGSYWLTPDRMGNQNGTAILVPGQYRKCWTIGVHRGKHPAFVQYKSPFKVWRDKDGDGKLTYGGQVYEDVTGLNGHTTSHISEVEKVGAYSAGCQVRQNDKDQQVVMSLAELSAEEWGAFFSYTLFAD